MNKLLTEEKAFDSNGDAKQFSRGCFGPYGLSSLHIGAYISSVWVRAPEISEAARSGAVFLENCLAISGVFLCLKLKNLKEVMIMKRQESLDALEHTRAKLAFVESWLCTGGPGEEIVLNEFASFGLYLILVDLEETIKEAEDVFRNTNL